MDTDDRLSDAELRQQIAEGDVRLRAMLDRDRLGALAKLAANDVLTEYERALVPYEWAAAERQRAERQQAAAAQEEKRQHVRTALRPKHIVYRSPTIEGACEHLIDLALFYDLKVINVGLGGRGKADLDARAIYVPPITNWASYAIGLHELGHAVDPDADSRQYRYQLMDSDLISILGEVAAWRFAVRTARPSWLAEMQEKLVVSLHSYAAYGTPVERQQIAGFVRWANDQVTDRPDPPEALEKTVDLILRKS